jgi:hypothetical protein
MKDGVGGPDIVSFRESLERSEGRPTFGLQLTLAG